MIETNESFQKLDDCYKRYKIKLLNCELGSVWFIFGKVFDCGRFAGHLI